MSAVLEALRRRGGTVALRGPGSQALSGSDVLEAAARLADELRRRGSARVALLLDNGPAWVVADLACLLAEAALVPLPSFFTASQLEHVLAAAAVDTLLFEPSQPPPVGPEEHEVVEGLAVSTLARPAQDGDGIARITFTSGTTGTPKGVCLSAVQLERVACSLAARVEGLALERHLVVLPLAVLLENVAGVHAGLLAGAEIVFPGPGETGLCGSSAFDPQPLLASIERLHPESLILLPQMLKATVHALRATDRRLDGLKFVAVGGARTAPPLIQEARALGLPVYEGYGLSECGSVVSLNTPDQDRPGSVGRILPHVQICVSSNHEIMVLGPEPVRYAECAGTGPEWFATGDLGTIDADGFLHIHGRREQALVTGFGRNVSPEWVESELLAEAGIAQALVFGDDLPGLAALLVPVPGVAEAELEAQLERANGRLPDYARVRAWASVAPFDPRCGQLTANGRPRRDRLLTDHADTISRLVRVIEQSTEVRKHDVLQHAH